MSSNITLRRSFALVGPFFLMLVIDISAQVDRKVAQAQQQNAIALRQYQWQSRTEIQKDGETKKVELSQMRYDVNGDLQKTIVSSTPETDMPKFGLRKAVAQKKVQNFKDTIRDLGVLARSYGEIPSEKMQRFMATASVRPEITAQHKLIRIEGRDVLQPGDSMTVFMDAVLRKQRRIEIVTSLEQKPVRIISEFADLPNGPTHVARSQVNYDSGSLIIVTENFNYVREQR